MTANNVLSGAYRGTWLVFVEAMFHVERPIQRPVHAGRYCFGFATGHKEC